MAAPYSSTRPFFWGPDQHSINPHPQISLTSRPGVDLEFSFCEEKYVLVPYIAECMNSVSALAYVCLALWGLRRRRSCLALYLSLAFVGLASSLNHMTLRLDAQQADQISMHLFASLLLYHALTGLFPRSRLLFVRIGFAFTIMLFDLSTVVAFLTWNAPKLHQHSFAAVCVLVTVVLLYHIEFFVGDNRKKILRRRIMTGIVAFVIGYGLWQLDFRTCRILRNLRHEIGLPYGVLLEFHGWWHVLTGLSGAVYIECIHILKYGEIDERYDQNASKARVSLEKDHLV